MTSISTSTIVAVVMHIRENFQSEVIIIEKHINANDRYNLTSEIEKCVCDAH